MQINRLFEIIYILLYEKATTAKKLADHFEVSIRTIYRDIDILTESGIPIYTSKGKGGGIRLVENFVLNKLILSEKEQNDILTSLQSLNIINFHDMEPILNKLSLIFNKQILNWIDVDFSNWGSNDNDKEKFSILKNAILNTNVITFDYFSSYGEKTKRTVEPIKLIFKSQSWYIYSFCKIKNDFRIFKVKRMKNIQISNETFKRKVLNNNPIVAENNNFKMIEIVLKIDENMAYRVYDEFDESCITKNEDKSYTVTVDFPKSDWIYGYIMSYGSYVEVIKPKYIREEIKNKLKNALNKYISES